MTQTACYLYTNALGETRLTEVLVPLRAAETIDSWFAHRLAQLPASVRASWVDTMCQQFTASRAWETIIDGVPLGEIYPNTPALLVDIHQALSMVEETMAVGSLGFWFDVNSAHHVTFLFHDSGHDLCPVVQEAISLDELVKGKRPQFHQQPY